MKNLLSRLVDLVDMKWTSGGQMALEGGHLKEEQDKRHNQDV